MTNKPNENPEWAEGDQAEVAEPSNERDNGWPFGYVPGADQKNWLQRMVGRWLLWLDHFDQNHDHGGSGDLAAPEVSADSGLDWGDHGHLEVETDTSSLHRIVHKGSAAVKEFVTDVMGVDLLTVENVQNNNPVHSANAAKAWALVECTWDGSNDTSQVVASQGIDDVTRSGEGHYVLSLADSGDFPGDLYEHGAIIASIAHATDGDFNTLGGDSVQTQIDPGVTNSVSLFLFDGNDQSTDNLRVYLAIFWNYED